MDFGFGIQISTTGKTNKTGTGFVDGLARKRIPLISVGAERL
jgi:hypothetical protein